MLNSNEVLNGNFASKRRFSSDHNGVDYPCPTGTACVARFNGVVTKNGTNPAGKDFGNYVIVAYDNKGLQGWYAHLSKFNLTVGARVTKGQMIGYSGNTGFVIPPAPQGNHLHYSESKTGTAQWVNPDTTQTGGDDMVTRQILEAIVSAYLPYRGVNAAEYTRDVGKPIMDVMSLYANSDERKQYQAKLAQSESLAIRVPALEARIAELEAQEPDKDKAIQALTEQVGSLTTTVADLEKKLAEKPTQTPTDPIGEDTRNLLDKIKDWFSKYIIK